MSPAFKDPDKRSKLEKKNKDKQQTEFLITAPPRRLCNKYKEHQ
jgi:hypothetical protein